MGKTLMLVFSIVISSGFAHAENKTYDDYVDQLTKHPSVDQILEEGRSFDSLSKGAMGLPDPTLILGVDNLPLSNPQFDRFLPSSKVIGIKQMIPNAKKRDAKSVLYRGKSKKNQLIAEYQISKLKAVFNKNLVDLEKVNKLEHLLKKQLSVYRLLEADLRGKLESGQSVYGRFSVVDLDRSEIEKQVNDLKAERVFIHESLIQLVGSVPKLILPLQSAKTWKINETPLYPLLIDQESVEISQTQVALAEADFKPTYGIQALYKQRESSPTFDGDDWFSLQASITLPIWSNSNQTPKLEAARSLSRSTHSSFEKNRRLWNQQISSLEAEIKYAFDNISLLQRKKKSLKSMMSSAERNYESGNISLDNVLDVQVNHLKIMASIVKQKSLYQRLMIEFNSHIKSSNINQPSGESNAS